MSACEVATKWEMPDYLDRCPGCARFVGLDECWGDHEKRGCAHRLADHECEMDPDTCGSDVCGCYLERFCSEACADRWHAGGSVS